MNAPEPALTPPGRLSQVQIRSIVIGLMAAMLLAALDQTIVATAMPTIGLDLGDAQNLPWIVTAYLLVSTAVTPLYGKLSDIHGRRIMLLIAIATFSIGSLFCALAPSMLLLALARGLQGVGGGGLIALAQTIIGDIMSPKERGALSGLYRVGLRGLLDRRSVARRLLCPASALVVDLLDQPADRISGVLADERQAQASAQARAEASARLPGRHPADPVLDEPPPGPELGRREVPLGLDDGARAVDRGRRPRCSLHPAPAESRGASHPDDGPVRPGGLYGNPRGLFRHGDVHRARHLRPDLLRGRRAAQRQPIGYRPCPADDRHRDRGDALGAVDDVFQALQAHPNHHDGDQRRLLRRFGGVRAQPALLGGSKFSS